MKILGFIQEHEGYGNRGKSFVEYLQSEKMDEVQRSSVIKYLISGHFLSGFMEWLEDCEDEDRDNATSIGPHGFYTDGKWIWSEYLAYYLKKHATFKIDDEFLADLIEQKYQMPEVSKEQKDEAQSYLLNFYERIDKRIDI